MPRSLGRGQAESGQQPQLQVLVAVRAKQGGPRVSRKCRTLLKGRRGTTPVQPGRQWQVTFQAPQKQKGRSMAESAVCSREEI